MADDLLNNSIVANCRGKQIKLWCDFDLIFKIHCCGVSVSSHRGNASRYYSVEIYMIFHKNSFWRRWEFSDLGQMWIPLIVALIIILVITKGENERIHSKSKGYLTLKYSRPDSVTKAQNFHVVSMSTWKSCCLASAPLGHTHLNIYEP